MKVYVYSDSGCLRFRTKEYKQLSERFIGTAELLVEPVKKKVVKEVAAIYLKREGDVKCFGAWLPEDAYEPVITYKIKE